MSLEAYSGTLSDEERRALGSALFTLLFLVSGADGTATRGEVAALERALAGLDAAFGEGHARALDMSPEAFARAIREAEGLGFHLLRRELTVARGEKSVPTGRWVRRRAWVLPSSQHAHNIQKAVAIT